MIHTSTSLRILKLHQSRLMKSYLISVHARTIEKTFIKFIQSSTYSDTKRQINRTFKVKSIVRRQMNKRVFHQDSQRRSWHSTHLLAPEEAGRAARHTGDERRAFAAKLGCLENQVCFMSSAWIWFSYTWLWVFTSFFCQILMFTDKSVMK